MISGIAVAIKEQRPKARIWGGQPQQASSMWAALRQGRIVSLDAVRSVADGLAASVTCEINLVHVQRYVEDVILVNDQAILDSMLLI